MLKIINHKDFLYQEIADHFEKLIEEQELKSGDRLPSVRSLSKEQGISLSTVHKAYSILENKGLIDGREKSGYYVKFSPNEVPHIQEYEIKIQDARKTNVNEMLAGIYKNISAKNILRFSHAAPTLELLPTGKLNKALFKAIRSSEDSCIGYDNVQGNVIFRQQIAKYSSNKHMSLGEDDIVTTAGCMEAMVFCLKAVTNPGDTVAIELPTSWAIFNIMKSLGLKVVEIPISMKEGVNIEYLKKAISKFKIKACLFVTNFNNPFGSCIPDVKKEELVRLLAINQIPLIEDDVYGEMYFGKKKPLSCKTFDSEGLVMLCSSVSKTLAPGYRVGWTIPGKFKKEIILTKLIHTIATTTVTQTAIGLFMQDGKYESHLRGLRKALHTQCLRYIQAIMEFFPADTKVSRPQGGYVLWIELNLKVNAMELYHRAINFNISISPGHIFSTGARFQNCIRISFVRPYDTEVERGLKTLGSLIKKMIAN